MLKDHNAVTPVGIEPTALRSPVKHSTTEPLRSLSTQSGETFGITECSMVHLNKYILYVGGGQWFSGRIIDSGDQRAAGLSLTGILGLCP